MSTLAGRFLDKKLANAFNPLGSGFQLKYPDLNISQNWDLSDIFQAKEDEEEVKQSPAPTSGALAGDFQGLIDAINRSSKETVDTMFDRAPELSAIRIQEAQAMQKLGLESIETAYKSRYMYDTLPKYAIAAAVAPNMFLRDVVESPLKMTGGHRAAQIGLNAGAANEPRVQI